MPHRHRRASLPVTVALAGAASFAALFSAAPASAQFFGLFDAFRGPPVVVRQGVIPPRMVAAILRAQGFALVEAPMRRGDRIIALGEDERGQVMRFVIDAFDGAVIRTALVGAPRPPGFIGGEPRAYAYRGPGPGVIYNEPVEPDPRFAPPAPGSPAPSARPKPKPKVAAKPPASSRPDPVQPKAEPASPPAEAASPSAPPSQATKAPEPVAPAAPPATAKEEPKPAASSVPPPVAARPVETPEAPVAARPAAPASRPGPTGQSADIGPKVVPVAPAAKPAEPPTP